jgi:fused signal recognition particle receptor
MTDTEKTGWLTRLKQGLSRSTDKLSSGITGVFTKKKLDAETLEALEEALITADIGVKSAGAIIRDFAKGRVDKEIEETEIRRLLARQIADRLAPIAQPLTLDLSKKPFVLLMAGVNGAGKTTTMAKLAKQYQDQGLKVGLVAGDTFRAAAVRQLQVWGDRIGCPVISGADGADAAGLAHDALTRARAEGWDMLLIDTAGRLHTKTDLMAELQKIVRVIQKIDPTAPHATLLCLDATTGQNALTQVAAFAATLPLTGLVVTKLDGSAKGGVLVALAEATALPVPFIGVGEAVEDLHPFTADSFAAALLGVTAD